MNELYEKVLPRKLAAYAHDAWSGWMKYLFFRCIFRDDGTVVIPQKLVARWTRQMNTEFDALPANEQQSDFDEAQKILDIFAELEHENSRLEKVLEDIAIVRE
jgi:hypothetical protein